MVSSPSRGRFTGSPKDIQAALQVLGAKYRDLGPLLGDVVHPVLLVNGYAWWEQAEAASADTAMGGLSQGSLAWGPEVPVGERWWIGVVSAQINAAAPATARVQAAALLPDGSTTVMLESSETTLTCYDGMAWGFSMDDVVGSGYKFGFRFPVLTTPAGTLTVRYLVRRLKGA